MRSGLDLDAIAARAAAATEGPWTAITDNGRKDGIGIVGQLTKRGTGEAIAVFAGVGGNRHADAEFTAHARDDVLDLLAEVEWLRLNLAGRCAEQPEPREHWCGAGAGCRLAGQAVVVVPASLYSTATNATGSAAGSPLSSEQRTREQPS